MNVLRMCSTAALTTRTASVSIQPNQFSTKLVVSLSGPIRCMLTTACHRASLSRLNCTGSLKFSSCLSTLSKHGVSTGSHRFSTGLRALYLRACDKSKVTSTRRYLSSGSRQQQMKDSQRSLVLYITATGVFMLGLAYAGVPLYRIFCQATGLGGLSTNAAVGHDTSKAETMKPVKDRIIKVKFNADVASSMRWNFKPQQTDVKVAPGETALAFYTATNPTDKPVIGISTYNVVPFEAGLYFNKIQCFCFEEQRLNPHEQVDMPVFFYIDPDFADDPKLEGVETITLSYTFFEAKEGFKLPLPGYMTL